MKLASRSLVFAALLSLCVIGSSSAQYMKLISDNPSDPTRMRSSGTTVLTVTLDTNHDRDGSVQTCNSHTAALGCGTATDNPLSLGSFTISLTAVGGTVTWGAFSPANSAYTDLNGGVLLVSTTQIEVDYSRASGFDAPGLYTLGTISVTPTSGAPGVIFGRGVQTVNPFGFGTGFGSECDANMFPNTYVLGDPGNLCATGDWFDADGIDPSSSTSTLTLSALHEMAVAPGSTADQAFSASDPDGAAITFSSAGPAFMSVSSNAQVGSTRTGTIHLAPPNGTSGTFAASVTASANGAADTRSFTIRILDIAPTLAQPNDMTVDEGLTADQALSATDQNGDPLTFSLAAGPSYASVATTAAGSGTATGDIHLAPGFEDAGTASATIRVYDGVLTDSKPFRITVNNVGPPPGSPVLTQPSDMTVSEGSLAGQTLRATDSDGDRLTFFLVSGPAYVSVTTALLVTGNGIGNIRLAPGFEDAGTDTVTVGVTDGGLSDRKSLRVTVNNVSGPPVLAPIANMTVAPGATADQAISASDPDADPITLTSSLPAIATLTQNTQVGHSRTGNIHVAPPLGASGTFQASVTATANGQSDDQTFVISVHANSSPTLSQPVDMTVNQGATADQVLNATDADGDPITFSLSAGPTFAAVTTTGACTGSMMGNIHLAPGLDSAGTFTAVVSVTDGSLSDSKSLLITVNGTEAGQDPAPTPVSDEADAFLTGANRVIHLSMPGHPWCPELAPASSSFQVADVVPSSITASYGTAHIHASGVTSIQADGGSRLSPTFEKGDLRALFASLPDGITAASVLINGDLVRAGTFEATVSVSIEKGPGSFGRASPNPFNPSTAISFELTRPGRVTLRVYDVSGRLVNTVADRVLGTGPQEVRWDGTRRDGSRVSSGVYFYVLETPERTVRKDLVVAK